MVKQPPPNEKLLQRILKIIKKEPLPLSQANAALAHALWFCVQETDDPVAEAERTAEFFTEGAKYLREEVEWWEAEDDDTEA
jgi:hypothetical protein